MELHRRCEHEQLALPEALEHGFFICLCYPMTVLAAYIRVDWDSILRTWVLGESHSELAGGHATLLQQAVPYLWDVGPGCTIKATVVGKHAARRYRNFVTYAPGTEVVMRFDEAKVGEDAGEEEEDSGSDSADEEAGLTV